MPEVTVVIPTRDRVGLLRQTLSSALGQTGVDHEVVVVDDGSRDGTPAYVEGRADPRVRLLRHDTSRGVAAARNAGIAAAAGDWIGFLDDDDLWAPDKLAAQLAAARAADRDWVYTGAVQFLDGPMPWVVGRIPPSDEVAADLAVRNLVPGGTSGVVARRASVVEAGGFDQELAVLADWDLWLKLLRLGPPAVTDRHLVAYRLHPTNMTVRNRERVYGEIDRLEERHRDLRAGRPLDRPHVHHWLGVSAWRAGQRAEARRAYLRALREGHLPAARWLLRALIPVDSLRRSLLRQPPPEWPPGMEEWLTEVLRA